MMSYTTGKTDARKKFAEIFTPPGVVFQMILADGVRECVKDVDKTILDPSCGEGQFPCCELVWKMFYNLDTLDETISLRALKSLYGIDIQPTSVAKTREHLLQTIQDAYKFFTGEEFTRLDEARAIVEENFICGDFLKFSNPQQTLF